MSVCTAGRTLQMLQNSPEVVGARVGKHWRDAVAVIPDGLQVTPRTGFRLSACRGGLVKWKTDKIVAIALIHLIAAFAFLPWFFSWTGVVLFGAGLFVFGTLGINLCYHRLLSHRSLACPRWLEHGAGDPGVCSLQDSPPHWVAVHRRHHQFADEDQDPHSPLAGFFWAHMGWLLVKMDDMSRGPLIERYAKGHRSAIRSMPGSRGAATG